jgi:uncharacterized Ntn-hydrolase superfamily protein
MITKTLLAAAAVVGFGVAAANATYSVTAFDPKTGQLGVAVQSHTPWSGARVRYGMAGVAAIASQASSDPMMGEVGTQLIQRGFSPTEARDMLVAMDNGAHSRQFAIVDTQGRSAGWTGDGNSGWAGHICQPNFCVEANTMVGPQVVNDMALAYTKATEQGLPLVERLIATLEAGEAAGGDRRGSESSGVMVFAQRSIADYGDHLYDLRVDDSPAPVAEIRRVYNVIQANALAGGEDKLIAGGNYKGAFDLIDQTLVLNPQRDQAYVERASVYLAMNDTRSAIVQLATAIKMNHKQYNQILRDDHFKAVWSNPDFLALGDREGFQPLAPSVFGGTGMSMPAKS